MSLILRLCQQALKYEQAISRCRQSHTTYQRHRGASCETDFDSLTERCRAHRCPSSVCSQVCDLVDVTLTGFRAARCCSAGNAKATQPMHCFCASGSCGIELPLVDSVTLSFYALMLNIYAFPCPCSVMIQHGARADHPNFRSWSLVTSVEITKSGRPAVFLVCKPLP